MSLAFGGAFRITHNAGEDNQGNNALKKVKLENGPVGLGIQHGKKREVLGIITNNVDAPVRVQPFRAAKAAVTNTSTTTSRRFNDENAYSRPAKSAFAVPTATHQQFTIHIDSQSVVSKAQGTALSSFPSQEPELGAAVTSLSRPPLSDIFAKSDESQNDSILSPMLVDKSCSDDDVECPSATKADREIGDIDLVDGHLAVPEYAADIFKYLKATELKNRPKTNYMKKQPDINNSMRAILVDWLVEVAEEYKLQPQTFYLTVNYIDRFLSSMLVLKGKLQLVGTACMLLASKFEEIYPPELSDFVYITDDTYTEKQVLKMEQLVLKALQFDLSVPTCLDFLDRFLKATGVPDLLLPQVESLAKYFCELTALDGDPYLKYVPSTIAASSVVLALHTLGQPSWTSSLAHYTGFGLYDLQACLHDLHRTFCHASKHPQQAIREKYKHTRYQQVADIQPPASVPLA